MILRAHCLTPLALIVLSACTGSPPVPVTAPCAEPAPRAMAPDAHAHEEVQRVLDDWHEAAAKADVERYFGHLAEDAIFLGTDRAERWNKAAFRAYAAPHFAKGKAWTFVAKRREVVFDPRTELAWFDEDLETQGLGPARGSGILARREGAWKVVQYNLAVTVPNERFALTKEAATDAVVSRTPQDDALAGLAFLGGSWAGETPDGGRFFETWTASEGGLMLGLGRFTKGGKTTTAEQLRLESRAGKIVYVAEPSGQKRTEFALTKSVDGEAVFENPKHDFPKRIRYEKVAGGLRVTIDAGSAERAITWTLAPAIVARSVEAR